MTLTHLFTEFVLAVTPSPSPSAPQFDENQVTPGPWGFVATFAVAAVVVLLIIDMTRRVRRVNYRAEVEERLQAELRERDEQGGVQGGASGASPASGASNAPSAPETNPDAESPERD